MKLKEKKSVAVEKDVARELAIEKAHSGQDIYELIRESWNFYKQRDKMLEVEGTKTVQALMDILDKQPLPIGMGVRVRRKNGKPYISLISLEHDDDGEEVDIVVPLLSSSLKPGADVPTTPEERELVTKLLAMIRDNDTELLPAIRKMLSLYLSK